MLQNTQLPSIRDAKLPAVYMKAKTALERCSEIDECMEWANKSQALASYAKQAKDESLERLARRIKARAIRRCGQLLKQVEKAAGGDQSKIDTTVKFGRGRAAAEAGLTERQTSTALRVATVPETEFEAMVDAEKPATISEIADKGTVPQQLHPSFPRATHLLGSLSRFAQFCGENDPADVAQAVMEHEIKKAGAWVKVIDSWLDIFVTNLEGRDEK